MFVQKRRDVNKMNSEELKRAIDTFSKESGMDKDYLYDSIELGLNSAYKKQYKLPNSRVDLNRETAEIKMFSYKTVVLDREHKESLDEGFKDDVAPSSEECKNIIHGQSTGNSDWVNKADVNAGRKRTI